MIRRTLATVILIMSVASPAAACDPYWDGCWWWWDEPVWQPAPEPAPLVPDGLYLVTEVYVADVVSVAGPLTTYSTATVADTPGTYARVLDTVSTGTASAYDGSAFNGRTVLEDGRAVAGTYYENFVLSDGEFVPVSVVFFQDDSALVAAAQPASPPTPVATSAPVPVTGTPLPRTPTARSAAPVEIPTEVARIDPLVEPALAAEPPPPQGGTPLIRAGISASPLGEVRSEIEVLRGRAIPLWIHAAVDGVPHPVASWRIRSGEHTALGPSSGDGDDALSARWDVVTPPGVAWSLGFDVTVVIAGVRHSSFGEIAVVVRSPALIR